MIISNFYVYIILFCGMQLVCLLSQQQLKRSTQILDVLQGKHIGKNRIRIELFYTFIIQTYTHLAQYYKQYLHTIAYRNEQYGHLYFKYIYESYIYFINITTNRNRLYTKDILNNIDIKLRKSIIITNLIFEETNLNKHSKDINLNNKII